MDTNPESVQLGLCSWRTLSMPPMLQLVHSSPPRAFTRPVCSWRALLVPRLMQLVHSSHASSLYSIRVLLVCATCTADDAACALFARLEPFLDSDSLTGTSLSRQCCSLCSDDSTYDVQRSTIQRLVAAPCSLENVSQKVPGACAALKQSLLNYKRTI